MKKSNLKSLKIGGLLFLLILLFVLTNTFIHSYNEYKKEYKFTIARISVTPTEQLEFYTNKGEKVSLWNYTIMSNENTKVGDSIYKGTKSTFLYRFSKDSSGHYKKTLKRKPSGIFHLFWFK